MNKEEIEVIEISDDESNTENNSDGNASKLVLNPFRQRLSLNRTLKKSNDKKSLKHQSNHLEGNTVSRWYTIPKKSRKFHDDESSACTSQTFDNDALSNCMLKTFDDDESSNRTPKKSNSDEPSNCTLKTFHDDESSNRTSQKSNSDEPSNCTLKTFDDDESSSHTPKRSDSDELPNCTSTLYLQDDTVLQNRASEKCDKDEASEGLSVFDIPTDSLSENSPDHPSTFSKSKKKQTSLFTWVRSDSTEESVMERKTHWKESVNDSDSDSSANSSRIRAQKDRKVFRRKGKISHNDSVKLKQDSDVSTSVFNSNLLDTKKEDEKSVPEVVPHYDITVAKTKIKFPVKPYGCQVAVMNALIRGCANQENCLLESPTGSGKTLALLCGALGWQEKYQAEMSQEIVKKITRAEIRNDGSDNNDKASGTSCDKEECGASCDISSDDEDCEDFSKNETYKVPKIYYGTRTHRQIQQVVKEFRRSEYKYKRMTVLSSRDHTCIQETDRNKTALCNELLDPTKSEGCAYYNDKNRKFINYQTLDRLKFDSPWDIEDLVSFGKTNNSCPYFGARNLMQDAEIIFCPYDYLIDPDIRESMQIDLKGDIIILDEAHNIEDKCRDVASVSFEINDLQHVLHECKGLIKVTGYPEAYEIIINYLIIIIKFIDSTELQLAKFSNTPTSTYWTGIELLQQIDVRGLNETSHQRFSQACNVAINDFNKATEKPEENMHVISKFTKVILEHMVFALNMITSKEYANDYRACIVEETKFVQNPGQAPNDVWIDVHKPNVRQSVRVLKLICMNPAVIFAPLAKTARCVVLASGTLAPTDSFQSELGTKFSEQLNASHVISKDQVYVTCIPRGPRGVVLRANFTHVKEFHFQDELSKVILDICTIVPHGVLCFFSSYKIMECLINRWQSNEYWSKISELKQIFLEPRNGSELADIMKRYREVIVNTSNGPTGTVTGALLFAVFRGKVAEGIDFSDNEARCVLTVGIPYPVQVDPAIQMKTTYNNINVHKGLLSGTKWYSVQAFRALNQALGRCIRHRNDWGAVILIDERFTEGFVLKYLPKWIRGMWKYRDYFELQTELKDFVERQIQKDSTKC